MALRIACFLLLSALALAVLWPGVADTLAGQRPLKKPSIDALDDLARFDRHDAKLFFDDRNQIEVPVPRAMPAKEFLALYLIDQPHIRDEIAQQEGWKEFSESAMLQEGRTYVITLTPPEHDAP